MATVVLPQPPFWFAIAMILMEMRGLCAVHSEANVMSGTGWLRLLLPA